MTEKDREMLIRVDERTAQLVGWTKTHIQLHERLTLAFYSAAISTVLALAATVFSLLRR